MQGDDAVDRIVGGVTDPAHSRGAALDIVRYMQCFGADGKPLFTAEQINRILLAVGEMALQAARSGDDRGLKRMLDAQLKLATVNAKLQEQPEEQRELNDLLSVLRDRSRAATPN